MTYIAPVSRPLKDMKPKHFSPNIRFTRQVNSINSYKDNKGDTAERYIKILLDLQPENEEDVYDYYDNQKDYHDNQEKHISGLVEDRTLNKEIENNSKLLTRNLSESQERKRCTKNNMENLEPRKLQLFQPLVLENIEDKKKPNIDSAELKNNNNRNLGLKKNNDDYFINILNQLIDKLNKSKNSKSTQNKDLLARKSNEPISLKNKSVEDKSSKNSSSEEELILRLERIKGNRIIDKLNSSPETTFVNGKWVRNKIQENKHNDLKPVDLRSEFNYTDEPISVNDLKQFNSTYPENQVIDTKGDILDNTNNLQVFDTQENKEISTSPQPEENEHFLVSRATIKPIYLTSTTEDKLDSTIFDENDTLQFMTTHTGELNNEDNNTNHAKLYESTLNNIHTTPKYEPTKDLPFDMNNILKTKNPEKIFESNVDESNNFPKTNNSEEVTTNENLSLAEIENGSSENNGYCHCNKKVVKNILSSTMVQNITEIKTNSYASPNNLKMSSHKRSDKLQKTNIDVKNITSNRVSSKNKKDLVSNLLLKNQITNENPTKLKFEPKVRKLLKSTLDIDDKINKNMKTVTNTLLQNNKTPKSKKQQLQSNGQKKRNNEENEKVIGIQKNKVSLISKNLQNTNPRQLVVPSKQYISKNDDYVRSNTDEYYDVDDIPENKGISTLFKSLNKIPNSNNSRIPFQSLSGPFKENIYHESSSRKYPENVITQLKHQVPINVKDQNIPINKGGYHNIDDATTPKKATNSHNKGLSLIPKKIDNKTLMSKYLEKVQNSDVNATKHKPRKLITESHKYAPFNQNPYTGNTQRKNINKDSSKNTKIINSLDLAKSRKPLNLVENNERANVINVPKYRYNGDEKVYATDIPTYSGISDKHNFEINNKVSKVLYPPGSRPIKNNEILKLKKPLTEAKTKFSLAPPVPAKTKIPIVNNRPFLKKQNTVTNQLPTQSLFVRKTDPVKNSTFQYDADLNVSFKPKVSKISHDDSSRDDAEHAPYKYEDLEPIIFDRPTNKLGSINKNSESVFRNSPGWQSARENDQLQNTQGFEPLHSVSMIRPEYDDYNDDSRKSSEGRANVKKHTDQPDVSNYDPANVDNTEDDGYLARDSKEKPANQSGFEVLPHIKVEDGMFKIPLVGHRNFDKNGSAYISDIYVPVEKTNGQHSALSLSELLTGDFRYVNKRPPTVEHTLEAGPPLSSTRIPKDRTSTDVAHQSCDPTILRAVKPSDDKQTSPIHIIQIINNGLCPNKHARNDTVNKSEQNDKVSSRKFQNGGQRVSMARSKDIVGNSQQMNRKIENAYDHFDSDILDRFLQVYAPPTV